MFDIDKMKEILEEEFYRMPSGITREEQREFMKDVADGEVEPRLKISEDTLKRIGERSLERYISFGESLTRKVTLTKEQLKQSGDESLKAYKDADKVFKLEEFIQL